MNTYVVDTECYKNFWSISFMDVKTRKVEHFTIQPGKLSVNWDSKELRKLLRCDRIVTFNGNRYDIPMIALALSGMDNAQLKAASDQIILDDMRPWQITSAHDVPELKLPNHIDLIEVAPGVASLKIYAGRLHAPVIQDLPFEPDREIDDDEIEELLKYTEHDLEDTRLLFKRLLPQLKLRQQMSKDYDQNLMSKSDAQIAEAVIRSELEQSLGHPIKRPEAKTGYTLKYTAPDFIQFASGELHQLLKEIESDEFIVSTGSGKLQLPQALRKRVIKIGDNDYKMGIGGLHSMEKRNAVVPADDEFLLDFDVASYYPSIILKCGLYPKHLGPKFLQVYRTIVEERLAAKADGDTVRANTLKIVVNGSFGKFGSAYSILFSPDLLIQTTVTGQLALLMLIERLENFGAKVVSANTDGVVVKVKRKLYRTMQGAAETWEDDVNMSLEETQYSAAYFRDVNNYLAVKMDGSVKSKGVFTKPGLAKNPAAPICASAVRQYLVDGTPIYDTIMGHDEVRNFISIRKVKGGASYGGANIGQSLRWYYSTEVEGALHYAINGNMVPKTQGARPLMTLPKRVPDDLDRRWYVMEAEDMLSQIGAGLV